MDRNSIKPLKDLLPEMKKIDGFPIADDEDILALSDPPFYTACPNPYIEEFIKEHGKPYDPETDDYSREPFVGDVSEGKNDPIYNAHSYHTKVPHKAIMKYIEHYTDEGDIVFDGFCGTGMTGVAAQMLGRKAILSDLSPAATFIAYNYNKKVDVKEFEWEAKRILAEVEEECGWMYETNHKTGFGETIKGRINYTVWSDVFVCPYCKNGYVFWDAAVDKEQGKVRSEFECPHCGAEITKRDCERAQVTFFDSAIGKDVTQTKQVPVLINYSIGKKRYEKEPDEDDLALIRKIDETEIPYWFPTTPIPKGDKTGEPLRLGITHVHHFYTKRNLWVMSRLHSKVEKSILKLWLTSIDHGLSKRVKHGNWSFPMSILSGTLYLPALSRENNPLYFYDNKIKKFLKAFDKDGGISIITIQSTTDFSNHPPNTIDYIFTDPPFGANLMYSELNFLWEAWLKVFTNNDKEAIMNNTQNKDLDDYKELMAASFREYYRVLKPNRWMTVEFHNSKASVWNAIQEAITRAGFIIAQVAVLDKQQGSFNQVQTASGAVKNDLVINAYKPAAEFADRFLKNAGEGMEVDFVSQQLEHLPVRPNIERTETMLYSKMLAHYVQNGFKIRYNSTNFYKLLSDNFTELDGYWFSDSQVKEYNRWKSGLSLDELREKLSGQQVLFVNDEKSALTWLYYYLATPHTYSDIYTEYQQVATTTKDAIPELRELLENNFILEDGKYRRPLNESEKADVKKNQEKELDRAFNKLLKQAKEGKGKIKIVRREALLHGFTKCYQEGRYQDILAVANKLYADTLESSGEIMDFVDIARIKTEGGK